MSNHPEAGRAPDFFRRNRNRAVSPREKTFLSRPLDLFPEAWHDVAMRQRRPQQPRGSHASGFGLRASRRSLRILQTCQIFRKRLAGDSFFSRNFAISRPFWENAVRDSRAVFHKRQSPRNRSRSGKTGACYAPSFRPKGLCQCIRSEEGWQDEKDDENWKGARDPRGAGDLRGAGFGARAFGLRQQRLAGRRWLRLFRMPSCRNER